ncbi:uncharacterized protein [Pyrus communis]|uniref:uncharacterized protein n=1 Tax=Pyrus communis TaxID=23211 RepID=UPI0035BEEC1A
MARVEVLDPRGRRRIWFYLCVKVNEKCLKTMSLILYRRCLMEVAGFSRVVNVRCLNPSPNILDSPPLPSNIPGSPPPPSNIPSNPPSSISGSAQQSEVTELDEILANLPADLGLRRRMLDYPLNYREAIHRYYLKMNLVNLNLTSCQGKLATIDVLSQGLAFRGHDESLKSSNRGNYIELMQFLADHNEKVRKVVLENAPKNLKYTSSDIQKDLVHACAIETINAITEDMEALVFVAKENEDVANFFINASSLVNFIGSSCKCRDAFREKQQEQIQKAHDLGNLETGKRWLNGLKVIATKIISVKQLERFCEDHDIIVPNMEDSHLVPGKSRLKAPKITNFHYYRVDLYFQVLDMQLKELNDRFNELSSDGAARLWAGRGRGSVGRREEREKVSAYQQRNVLSVLLTFKPIYPDWT